MATMREVADKAGVSMGAVSRILNKDPSLSVTAETRQRVLKAAAELGYRQSVKHNENKMRNGSRKSILLILALSEQEEHADPYFMQIREGIERQAVEFNVRIGGTYRGMGSLGRVHSMELAAENDGIIVIGHINPAEVKALFPDMEAVVFVDYKPEFGSFDSVKSDLGAAVKNGIDYLVSLGAERIGFISGQRLQISLSDNKKLVVAESRACVFNEYMQQKKRRCKGYVHYLPDWTAQSGYEIMKNIISQGNLADAYIIGSDMIAMGVMKACNEMAIKIPEKLKLLSFNDMPGCAFWQPALTSVHIETIAMGREAMKLMYERLQWPRNYPVCMNIPTRLMIRQSTGGKADEFYGRQLL